MAGEGGGENVKKSLCVGPFDGTWDRVDDIKYDK
jgi:hypothetical protein